MKVKNEKSNKYKTLRNNLVYSNYVNDYFEPKWYQLKQTVRVNNKQDPIIFLYKKYILITKIIEIKIKWMKKTPNIVIMSCE
jgi:hypothetical protein